MRLISTDRFRPSCSTSAPTTTIAPTIRIRNAAGPSPTLNLSKLRPQFRQRGANDTQPSNSVWAPQRWQSPRKAHVSGDGSATASLAVRRRAPAAPDVDGGEKEQPH